MARTSKNHDNRKSEILETARSLFYSKGYEVTTIEDVLQAATISKGAFYHYFTSKEDLLDCLVMQISEKVMVGLKSVFDDPKLGALQKLRKATVVGRDIKSSNKDLLLAYLKAVYRDENLTLRHKINRATIDLCLPFYISVINQGITEGVFNTPSPEFTARMILIMAVGIQELFWKLFVELDKEPENISLINKQFNLYEDAIERLLGAPEGSLNLVTEADIRMFQGGANEHT